MHKSPFTYSFLALAGLSLGLHAMPAVGQLVVVNEDFDGSAPGITLTENFGDLTPTTGSALDPDGTALLFDANASQIATGTFGTQTLAALGDSISVTFDVAYVGLDDPENQAFRYGLGGDADTTNGFQFYVVQAANGTATEGQVARDPGNDTSQLGGGGQVFLANQNNADPAGSFAIQGTDVNTVTLTLERITIDDIDRINFTTSISVDGAEIASITRDETLNRAGDSQFVFDTLAIGKGGSGDNYLVDNIVVTSNIAPIPEPGTLALTAFGAAALLRRRRASQA